ncbi:MEDS domain-containing protein [Actinoplanes sp. NPDC051411]|uniref:MEDS domain-containing protein n=1 Tax=Actinoplanes sp. NPDC051411 TaxID=3155522 RepID=UPI00343B4C7A
MVADHERRGWIGALDGAPRDNTLRLLAVGEFDAADRADLTAKLRTAVTSGLRAVELDLGLVTLIDSAVVDILLATAQLAVAYGCRFRVVNPIGLPAQVLAILDTDRTLGPQPRHQAGLPDPGLRPGDHACALITGPAELQATVQAFIGAGLRAGDKCLCLLDHGSPTDDDTAPCQLEVRRSTDVYLSSGAFRPAEVIDYLDQTLDSAVNSPDGYDRVRAAGDMGWAVSHPAGTDRLFDYEAEVNHLAPRYPQMLLCLYDLARFGTDVLPELLRTHPKVLVGGVLLDSPQYMRPPRE